MVSALVLLILWPGMAAGVGITDGGDAVGQEYKWLAESIIQARESIISGIVVPK